MNERIKELANQAEGEFYISCGNQVPTWYFKYNTLEKFVELIVKECADFVEQDQGSGDALAGRLKQQFGVEE